MKKIRSKGSLNGSGIAFAVLLTVIMTVIYWHRHPDEKLYLKLLSGILGMVYSLTISTVGFVALIFIFFAAIHLSSNIFTGEDSVESLLEHFTNLLNPIFLIVFIAGYIIILFYSGLV